MLAQSILTRTLMLFVGSFVAAVLVLTLLLSVVCAPMRSMPRVLRIRGQERAVAEVHAEVGPEGVGSTPPERTITGEEQVR